MIKKTYIKDDRICCFCKKLIPKDSFIVKNEETANILCLICLIELAECL